MLLDRFPGSRPRLPDGAGLDRSGEREPLLGAIVPSPAFDPLRNRYGRGPREASCARKSRWSAATSPTRTSGSPRRRRSGSRTRSTSRQLLGQGHLQPAARGGAARPTSTGTLRHVLAFANGCGGRRWSTSAPASSPATARARSGRTSRSSATSRAREIRGPRVQRREGDRRLREARRARARRDRRTSPLADRFRELRAERFLRGGPRPRRREGPRASPSPASARTGSARELTELGIAKAPGLGLAQHLHLHQEPGRPARRARKTGVVRAIVRPAIVESALEFPFPGWNEGFTTTAPLVRLALRGQNLFPVATDVDPRRDAGRHGRVRGAGGDGAGDRRGAGAGVPVSSAATAIPSRLGRLVDLLGLFKRSTSAAKTGGNGS